MTWATARGQPSGRSVGASEARVDSVRPMSNRSPRPPPEDLGAGVRPPNEQNALAAHLPEPGKRLARALQGSRPSRSTQQERSRQAQTRQIT